MEISAVRWTVDADMKERKGLSHSCIMLTCLWVDQARVSELHVVSVSHFCAQMGSTRAQCADSVGDCGGRSDAAPRSPQGAGRGSRRRLG